MGSSISIYTNLLEYFKFLAVIRLLNGKLWCYCYGLGCYNDIEMKVTNFNNEDKGTTLLAGDVFDVPIRRDIVHRVVVWQLAKRRQVIKLNSVILTHHTLQLFANHCMLVTNKVKALSVLPDQTFFLSGLPSVLCAQGKCIKCCLLN